MSGVIALGLPDLILAESMVAPSPSVVAVPAAALPQIAALTPVVIYVPATTLSLIVEVAPPVT